MNKDEGDKTKNPVIGKDIKLLSCLSPSSMKKCFSPGFLRVSVAPWQTVYSLMKGTHDRHTRH
jgi:hypothetical protein